MEIRVKSKQNKNNDFQQTRSNYKEIFQEDMKILKNFEKKEIEKEIHIFFSCNKYDYIQRKAFNNINEVDNIKLQIGKESLPKLL